MTPNQLFMIGANAIIGTELAAIAKGKDSPDFTGCCFAPRSPGDTAVQHIESPECTGRLLRDLLVVITTGLAPASKR